MTFKTKLIETGIDTKNGLQNQEAELLLEW